MGESAVGGEVNRVVESARELQESASSLISRISGEENTLRQRALALDSTLRRLNSSLSSLDPKDAQKMEEELCKASYILTEGDAATFLPSQSHGRFMSAMLGPINVRASRKDIQLKVKEEYNSFRDRTAFLFLFFPSLLLVLRSYLWDGCFPALPVQLYQAWLLFIYTGLALRENILRVNGSNIRPWKVSVMETSAEKRTSLGEIHSA